MEENLVVNVPALKGIVKKALSVPISINSTDIAEVKMPILSKEAEPVR